MMWKNYQIKNSKKNYKYIQKILRRHGCILSEPKKKKREKLNEKVNIGYKNRDRNTEQNPN